MRRAQALHFFTRTDTLCRLSLVSRSAHSTPGHSTVQRLVRPAMIIFTLMLDRGAQFSCTVRAVVLHRLKVPRPAHCSNLQDFLLHLFLVSHRHVQLPVLVEIGTGVGSPHRLRELGDSGHWLGLSSGTNCSRLRVREQCRNVLMRAE